MTTLDQVNLIRTYLTDNLLERYRAVQYTLAALVAKQHVFMLGPPGTGKSYLVELLSRCFTDSTYFYYLMGKQTKPSQIFGNQSLSALREDRIEYKTKGFFPEATFAMIDELYKGNNGLVNMFLNGMNERTFVNGDTVMNIPLRTMFAASNETPGDDDSLQAVYDRFAVRLYCDNLSSDENFLKMLNLPEPGQAPALTLPLLDAAYDEVMKVQFSAEYRRAMCDVRNELRYDDAYADVYASDRRWKVSDKIVRAAVWLDGRDTVEADDILHLEPVLWSEKHQREQVEGVLLNRCSEVQREVSVQITKLRDIVRLSERTDLPTILTGYIKDLEEIDADLHNIRSSRAVVKTAKAVVLAAQNKLQAKHHDLTGRAYNYKPNLVPEFTDPWDLGL